MPALGLTGLREVVTCSASLPGADRLDSRGPPGWWGFAHAAPTEALTGLTPEVALSGLTGLYLVEGSEIADTRTVQPHESMTGLRTVAE